MTAFVNITSNPTGANVFIKDVEIDFGKTPVKNVKLEVGVYEIWVNKTNYKLYRNQNYRVNSKDLVKNLHVELIPVGSELEYDYGEDDEIFEEGEFKGTIKEARAKAIENFPVLTKILELGIVVESSVIVVLASGGVAAIAAIGTLIAEGAAAAGTLIGGLAGGITLFSAWKTASAFAGTDLIMVWMAEDNIISGTSFTMKKLRDAVKVGAIHREDAFRMSQDVKKWIDAAAKIVEESAKLNPLLIPFKEILLVNVEKGYFDWALEDQLLRSTYPPKKKKEDS